MITTTIIVNNKKAYYNYEILDKEIVGVVLVGSELKPLRNGKTSISESFIYIDEEKNCPIIKNMYISENESHFTHEETRERRLLMKKKNIEKWQKKMRSGGITIIPLKGFFDKRNVFKMEIGLCKGKNTYDKRESLKKKDADRKIKNTNKE